MCELSDMLGGRDPHEVMFHAMCHMRDQMSIVAGLAWYWRADHSVIRESHSALSEAHTLLFECCEKIVEDKFAAMVEE